MKFHTTIRQGGKTATGIQVPTEVVDGLGAGKRPPVRVTINGYTYRSSIAVMEGKFMVGVSAVVREHARVKGGDAVTVDIELDTEPREVSLPADFKKALDDDKTVRTYFDGLSNSKKQRLVLPIGEAKSAETRERRIAKALSTLREGKI